MRVKQPLNSFSSRELAEAPYKVKENVQHYRHKLVLAVGLFLNQFSKKRELPKKLPLNASREKVLYNLI